MPARAHEQGAEEGDTKEGGEADITARSDTRTRGREAGRTPDSWRRRAPDSWRQQRIHTAAARSPCGGARVVQEHGNLVLNQLSKVVNVVGAGRLRRCQRGGRGRGGCRRCSARPRRRPCAKWGGLHCGPRRGGRLRLGGRVGRDARRCLVVPRARRRRAWVRRGGCRPERWRRGPRAVRLLLGLRPLVGRGGRRRLGLLRGARRRGRVLLAPPRAPRRLPSRSGDRARLSEFGFVSGPDEIPQFRVFPGLEAGSAARLASARGDHETDALGGCAEDPGDVLHPGPTVAVYLKAVPCSTPPVPEQIAHRLAEGAVGPLSATLFLAQVVLRRGTWRRISLAWSKWPPTRSSAGRIGACAASAATPIPASAAFADANVGCDSVLQTAARAQMATVRACTSGPSTERNLQQQ